VVHVALFLAAPSAGAPGNGMELYRDHD
jgi:hypothetical protein